VRPAFPDSHQRTTFLTALTLVGAALLVCGCKQKDTGEAAAPGWHVVTDSKDKFRFEAPAKADPPKRNEIEGATLSTYQVKGPDGGYWQLQTMPLPPFLTDHTEAALTGGFDTAVMNMLGTMGASKQSERRLEVRGMPAIEVRATGQNRDREFQMISRLIVSKERNMLFQMMAYKVGGTPDDAKATLFFDSLKLL